MLNSCTDPLVCTQETAAYLQKSESLSIEMRSQLPSVKKRAVRYNGAVLTYAPTYSPKEVSAQVILTAVSNFTMSSVRRVFQRLQHSQSTVFCCSRLLSALPTKFQSNQPAIFLAAEFDGSLCEQAVHASTRPCRHALTCLPKSAGYCLCALRSIHTCFE